MLSFAVVFGFLAAVNCVVVTTVDDVNAVTDKIIAELKKSGDKIDIAELPGVKLVGLQNLTRDGNCKKLSKEGLFECKAVSESKLTLGKEHEEISLHMTFEVTVDSNGHLVKYEIVETEVDFKEEETTTDNYYGWVKKHLHHLKHAITNTVKKAVHTVIQEKVKEIVTSIAVEVVGSVVGA